MTRSLKRFMIIAALAAFFGDIATAVPATAQSPAQTPTPTPDFLAKLPRDEKGRVIGGELFPVINYSPTMITGKPCPRVTKWEFAVVKMQPPLRDYGVVKNPCVVQNAVDDLARTLWFNPAFQNPETMKAIEKVYDKDPMNVDGVEKTLRQSLIDLYRKGQQNYNACDKSVFRLLNVDAKAALIADNDGRVSGQAIQIMILRATRDVQPAVRVHVCVLQRWLGEGQLQGDGRGHAQAVRCEGERVQSVVELGQEALGGVLHGCAVGGEELQ